MAASGSVSFTETMIREDLVSHIQHGSTPAIAGKSGTISITLRYIAQEVGPRPEVKVNTVVKISPTIGFTNGRLSLRDLGQVTRIVNNAIQRRDEEAQRAYSGTMTVQCSLNFKVNFTD